MLVRAAEVDRLDDRARPVCGEDRDGDGCYQPERAERRRQNDAGAAQVAEPARLARTPEQHGGHPEEHDADWGEQEAGPVLAPGADGARIGDREPRSLERKRTEHGCEHSSPAGRQARVDEHGEGEYGEAHRAARQVVCRPRARLGRDERVDGGVHRDDSCPAGEHHDVAARRREVPWQPGRHANRCRDRHLSHLLSTTVTHKWRGVIRRDP